MTQQTLDHPATTRAAAHSRLRAVGLSVGYGDHLVVRDLDLDLVDHAVTTVIGPNGCGKSTLLRALGRLLRPADGHVLLDGKRIDRTPTKQVATELALLPQSPLAPEGLVVRDLVARGRHPRQSWLRQWSADDEAVVARTLAWTSMTDLADHPVDELSGGQRQRAWIAMALAQQTDLVLLDEPTTYLDLSHQIEVLDLARTLNHEHGRTVVMVLHDLNLAARYSDQVVALHDGRVVASGTPETVITPALLRDVFGLDARVIEDPVTGKPLVVPIGCARPDPRDSGVSAAGSDPSGSRSA